MVILFFWEWVGFFHFGCVFFTLRIPYEHNISVLSGVNLKMGLSI